MAKLLVFSFFPANLPPRSGGELRLFALYEALSRHHEVTLLTSGELMGARQELQHNAGLREIRIPKGGEFAETWATLQPQAGSGDLSGPCLAAAALLPNALIEAYLALHAEADVIIHDSPFTVAHDLFIGHDGKPRIYNSYNVEFDLYAKIHADAPSDRIVEIVRTAEEKLVRGADIIAACSQADLTRFAELYSDLAAAMLLPNGVDTFSPPRVAPAGNRLVFIGSAHHPNREAAAVIRDVLAPRFSSHVFDVLGRCLDPGQPAANVVSHGVVDDAQKARLLAAALACVNPMREGSGSSLKIPDMAAHGVPLISTELGARGYDLVPGVHYSLIDPDDIVGSVREALSEPRRMAEQAVAAADHFAKHFTWPQIAQRFAAAIDRLLADRPADRERSRVAVLNDYDPFATIGGGSTRIRGLYEGASVSIHPIILTFGEDKYIVRRELFGGRGLAIAIPKTATHRQADIAQGSEFHVSTADLVAMDQALANPLLRAAFRATESFTRMVVCEHPYMASLLTGEARRFVYSSQNCETALKRQLLACHPRRDQLLAGVAAIEQFCIGCSELVVAVSEEDAATFASDNDLLAPLVVVSNGAEDPVIPQAPVPLLPGFNACFLGSGHFPNHQAVQFLLDQVAPALPEVTFHVAGSVCDGFAAMPANVVSHGRLDDAAKTRLLMGCQIALNPMLEGSGSNIKVADYLKHGLRVLSTPFGARGYGDIPNDDLAVAELDGFAAAIARQLEAPQTVADRNARQTCFRERYSMRANGAEYGAILATLAGPRRRALFVTYRYNAQARGGGEQYVNRLVSYLADAGVAVDVLTPKVDAIVDTDRFASTFSRDGGAYPVPFGHPLIRVAKFETAPVPGQAEHLRRAWSQQPAFEQALYGQIPPLSQATGLLWGWLQGVSDGRWTMDRFAMRSATAGSWRLTGHAPGPRYLVIRGNDGAQLLAESVEGRFAFRFDAPPGVVEVAVFRIADDGLADPRPLGLYVTDLWHADTSLIGEPALAPWQQGAEPLALFKALHEAARQTRFAAETSLADNRGPYAPRLEEYLSAHAGDYDLIISHNAVFRTTTRAITAARAAGVPSIIVPHAHFEDDYYHFPDVIGGIAQATRALVTPPVACGFLKDIGLTNVDFLSPGIDAGEAYSRKDEEAFRAIYRRTEPFVLVAGRKAAAKNYRHVIAAVAALRAGAWPELRVVLIGPDDDKQPVAEDFVDIFGMVERAVLRGAYRAATVLANMSRSESFGIVLLEAGLAQCPVVANADCAAFVELVNDGENGYLANPVDLADRVAAILGDPVRARAMGKAGRKLALAYDWDRIGAQFVRHCNEVMNAAGAPR